jgi:hypothetical protein
METLPEFVKDQENESETARPAARGTGLTGWETVIFQVVDEPESAASTAAAAP